MTTTASPQAPPQRRHRQTSKCAGPSQRSVACHLPAVHSSGPTTTDAWWCSWAQTLEVYTAAQRAEPSARSTPPPATRSTSTKNATRLPLLTEARGSGPPKPHGHNNGQPWSPSSQSQKLCQPERPRSCSCTKPHGHHHGLPTCAGFAEKPSRRSLGRWMGA